MRVIAGSAGGRRLTAPPGRSTRPTSDRVREALFSALADQVAGAVVCDLFAGSGALGIEALSRGASFVVFVDDDRRATRAVTENLSALRLRAAARVLTADAARFCADPLDALGAHRDRAKGLPGPFDLILADPPYALALPAVLGLLDDLAASGTVAPGALAVVERDRRDPDVAALEAGAGGRGQKEAGAGGRDEREAGDQVGRSFGWVRNRTYGDTVLCYLRRVPAEEPP